MKLCESGLLLILLAASPAAAAAADQLSLTIDRGRVTLVASDVTAGQILDEWARVGGTTVVNRDTLPDTPVTLQLTSGPEKLALDVILRSASGFVAAPRHAENPGRSLYGRIFVLNTSTVPTPPQPLTSPLVAAGVPSSPGVPSPVSPLPGDVEVTVDAEEDDAQVLPLPLHVSRPAGDTPQPARAGPPAATTPFGTPAGASRVPGIVAPVSKSLPEPMSE